MRTPTIEHVEQMLRDALSAEQSQPALTRLMRQLDELDAEQQQQRRARVSLASSALWYAEQGLHVFPLMQHSKQPFPRSHGCNDATNDVEQVRRWWGAAPTANIGIATGHIVDVIDIDGLAGNVELCKLLAENSRALDRVVGKVSTPRAGGRHLYLPAKGYGNGAKLADAIDYRGAGGYVVAPPSFVIEQSYRGVYQWTSPLDVERARRGAVRQ